MSGGEGDDWISAASNGFVDGGSGNDTLTVAGSVVSGGTGDDTIYDKRGSTVVSAGDGTDTIYAGGDTTIKLGEGLTADKMQVEVSGSTATISFGDGSDQITLHIGHRSPVTVVFADGTRRRSKTIGP